MKRSICIIMTDKCNAECKTCCFSCSPKNSSIIDEKLMLKAIDDAAELGNVDVIGFSGGEPFLYYELMKKGIYECSSLSARCPFDNTITVLFDGTMMMCCSQFSRDIDMVKVGKFGETTLKDAIDNLNSNDFLYVLLNRGFGWYVELARSFGKNVREKCCVSCHLCHELFTDQDFIERCKPFVEKEAQCIRVRHFIGV